MGRLAKSSVTGRLDRVYLDAVPFWWAERRLSRQVVTPVYRVPSAQHRM